MKPNMLSISQKTLEIIQGSILAKRNEKTDLKCLIESFDNNEIILTLNRCQHHEYLLENIHETKYQLAGRCFNLELRYKVAFVKKLSNLSFK